MIGNTSDEAESLPKSHPWYKTSASTQEQLPKELDTRSLSFLSNKICLSKDYCQLLKVSRDNDYKTIIGYTINVFSHRLIYKLCDNNSVNSYMTNQHNKMQEIQQIINNNKDYQIEKHTHKIYIHNKNKGTWSDAWHVSSTELQYI